MNIVLVVSLQTKFVEPVTLELQSENCIRYKFNLQLPCFKDWELNFAEKWNLIIRRLCLEMMMINIKLQVQNKVITLPQDSILRHCILNTSRHVWMQLRRNRVYHSKMALHSSKILQMHNHLAFKTLIMMCSIDWRVRNTNDFKCNIFLQSNHPGMIKKTVW